MEKCGNCNSVKERVKFMKLRNKLRNASIAGKLNVYRICMIACMVIMGIISGLLSFMMHNQVQEITNVWQPSLSCVQELNSLTSDYRLQQYGHMVAEDSATKDAYETRLNDIDQWSCVKI